MVSYMVCYILVRNFTVLSATIFSRVFYILSELREVKKYMRVLLQNYTSYKRSAR